MTDYTVGDTIHIGFSTRAFATGIPTTLAGTPVVSAYEDAGLTQITAGITLGVDHDSVTGANMLTIVASGANGYESGKDYNLMVTTGTVGGVSVVGEFVGRFTLGRSAAAVDLANVTDGLGAIKTVVDGASTHSAADVWSAVTRTLTAGTNLNDISVADILTTQMTESYAANGTAPTLAQAQFALHQMLMQFIISGTSYTVRQLDNSTTAFTVTLDDGTSPTSAVRV